MVSFHVQKTCECMKIKCSFRKTFHPTSVYSCGFSTKLRITNLSQLTQFKNCPPCENMCTKQTNSLNHRLLCLKSTDGTVQKEKKENLTIIPKHGGRNPRHTEFWMCIEWDNFPMNQNGKVVCVIMFEALSNISVYSSFITKTIYEQQVSLRLLFPSVFFLSSSLFLALSGFIVLLWQVPQLLSSLQTQENMETFEFLNSFKDKCCGQKEDFLQSWICIIIYVLGSQQSASHRVLCLFHLFVCLCESCLCQWA